MYTPSANVESPDVEIVCLFTGESYVYLEGNNKSIINPGHANQAIDQLPNRFFKQPFVVRRDKGIRVFGSIE
jgi:hypothetical protein